MKTLFTHLIHKPRVVIPVGVVIALIVGVFAYNAVGRAPVVTLQTDASTASSSVSSTGTYALSFLKTGRLATLSVKTGDTVKQGEVLATLDAGDALGALNQAKGALELAKAQLASLNVQYANTKITQDTLVNNAYRTLLSSGLTAVAHNRDGDSLAVVDSNQAPQITGTYTCGKEGSYSIEPYASGAASGYSFTYHGLETGSGEITNYTTQALGTCGLSVQFPAGYHLGYVTWVITIPNTNSAAYIASKNAYDSAVATRDQVLKQLAESLGTNSSAATSAAQAAIDTAQGAYEVAQANYNNTIITAPVDGTVSFVDSHLKIGQTIATGSAVITITH